jgi:hypothetical protein
MTTWNRNRDKNAVTKTLHVRTKLTPDSSRPQTGRGASADGVGLRGAVGGPKHRLLVAGHKMRWELRRLSTAAVKCVPRAWTT